MSGAERCAGDIGARGHACSSTSIPGGGKGESRERTVERSLVGDIVYQQDAHGAAVVGGGDGAEALLAGRVPDLQLDALAIELDGPDLEVDADGGDEGRGEGVLAEAQQAARLADARVAYEEQLDLWRRERRGGSAGVGG